MNTFRIWTYNKVALLLGVSCSYIFQYLFVVLKYITTTGLRRSSNLTLHFTNEGTGPERLQQHSWCSSFKIQLSNQGRVVLLHSP